MDRVIVLEEGKVVVQGRLAHQEDNNCASHCQSFFALLCCKVPLCRYEDIKDSPEFRKYSSHEQGQGQGQDQVAEKEQQEAGMGTGAEEEEESREEERQVGRVRLADYKHYIKVLGPWLCLGTGGNSLASVLTSSLLMFSAPVLYG